jgi:hypothetical protein
MMNMDNWLSGLTPEQRERFFKALDKAAKSPPVKVRTRELPSRKKVTPAC